MNFFSLIRLLGLSIVIGILSACSNSEYVDEFGVPISMYAPDDDALDGENQPDTLNEFPPSGFFAKPFTIVLPERMNCETGGFVPTKNSPVIRTLHIDSSTTIRCAFFLNDSSLATETIRTYLFEKKPTIPTIFITTDPNSLFDPDTGIYMEGPNAEEAPPHYGANYWLDKEIPIFIELIEVQSNLPAFSKKAGLKIFGNFSRMRAKKSVSINFRKKYGDSRLYYTLFPEFPNLNKFKSFILRNNGNNFVNDYIRDRLASSISEGLNVDYQRGRFALVYYNNTYFGIHDIRERSNEYYFETHYDIDHENINLLKADNSVSAGSSIGYTSLINWLKTNNLQDEKNYAYMATHIDIDNFINYIHVELFANNRDWPRNNLKKWNQIIPETPWKWLIYDMDHSWGAGMGNAKDNIFEYASAAEGNTWANPPEHTFLLRSLLKNKEFTSAFINRMATLLQMNFESSHILTKIEKMMKEIEFEIPRDQKRWNHDVSNMNKQLKKIKTFAQERQANILLQLQEYFKLGDFAPVTLSVTGQGTISVHGLPISNTPLTIKFFEDYPVKITAEPRKGSIWSGWSDGMKEETRTIRPGKDKELIAIFK